MSAYRRAATPNHHQYSATNTSTSTTLRGSNLTPRGGNAVGERTATSVNLESSFSNNNNTDASNNNSNINSKPVLVVARVRDFAPLEDPTKRSVFVTGERTCFVQLPHQRGKVDFVVDSVIGGTGEDDIDPRTGQPVYHPQIHYQQQKNGNTNQQNNNNNNNNSNISQLAYEYHAKHPNVITSPFSPAVRGRGSQQAVYDRIGAPLVDCLVQGRNATILTYGPTSSGKTFTSFGPKDSLGTPLEGLIPRMVQGVFEACNAAQGFFHTNISVTILEVYLEDVYDLLDPSRPKLKLRGDTNRGFVPVGETTVRVSSYEQVRVLLADAEKRRMTLDMSQHHRSSRSHVLFFLNLQRFMAQGVELSSKLLVADLAGSERTQHKNDPPQGSTHFHQHEQNMKFESAISINMSLLALGSVIEAAARSDGNVYQNSTPNTRNNNNTSSNNNTTLLPEFRRSTLTKLMKDHIGGNSRTVVLVTCSPTAESANNSIQALRFGQRAMKVRTQSRINVAIRGANSFTNVPSMRNNNTSSQQQQLQLSMNNNNNSQAGAPSSSMMTTSNNNSNSNNNDTNAAVVVEAHRARLAKRRLMVEVECALEEELLHIRQKIQRLENDLSLSPFPGTNYNNSSSMIITSDIVESRAKELQQAIAEEARIERDLFTLFDCPSGVVSSVLGKYSKRSSTGSHPDYRRAMNELNQFLVASESQQQEYFLQQSSMVDDDDIEAEECTLFAVVRKRHETELNDVRAQAWRTSNNNPEEQKITSLSPRSPSQQYYQGGSPIRENVNGDDNNISQRQFHSIATSPLFRPDEPSIMTSTGMIATSPSTVSSPSRNQLEKLLSDANEEIDSLRARLDDREQKCAELAQKLIMGDRQKRWEMDLSSIEHEESLSRSSLETSQMRFLSQLNTSYVRDRTRLEYYGHLRKTLDDRERAFGGERERQLRRDLEEARREARNAKEEAEGCQIKLEIAESERMQLAKESDTRWKRATDLEHQVEILKTENEQLKNHAEVLKTHYEHQVNLQDLQRERLRNDTQMSLTRMKYDSQRSVEEMKKQQLQKAEPTTGGTSSPPHRQEATRQPSEVSDTSIPGDEMTPIQKRNNTNNNHYHLDALDENLDRLSYGSTSQQSSQQQQQQQQPSFLMMNKNNFETISATGSLEERMKDVERILDKANASRNHNNDINRGEQHHSSISGVTSLNTSSQEQYHQQHQHQQQHQTYRSASSLATATTPTNNVSPNNNQVSKEDRERLQSISDIRYNHHVQQQQGDKRDGSNNTHVGMSETLSTSQLSAVNRYYATILAERERVNHSIADSMNGSRNVSLSRQQQRYQDYYHSMNDRNDDANDHLYDHRRRALTSPSETEYHLGGGDGNREQQQQQQQQQHQQTTDSASLQQHERLKLLEQQLILERQRAEQKRMMATTTTAPADQNVVGIRNTSSSQSQQQQQQPRYFNETISSQSRHSYSLGEASDNNTNHNYDISTAQLPRAGSKKISPTAPSWSSRATSNLASNISRSYSRPANVAQDNVIGSPY